MAQKIKRTLGPAAFEAYMEFADSLRTPENSDAIDRFKYDFAVMEGYITPKKKKTLTEGQLGLGDFEKAFQGLVGAFLPHLDSEEQAILGTVCENLDRKINSGDLGGAQDILHGAMKGLDDDVEEEEETCEDGSCEGNEPNDAPADEECCQKPLKEAMDGRPPHELYDDRFPAIQDDDDDITPLDFEDNSDLLPPEEEPDIGIDYPEEDGTGASVAATDEVDYDALADQLLSNSGDSLLTSKNGGIRPENSQFWD